MSEWTEKPLCQLASIDIGGTPSRNIPQYWATQNEEGFPWVSIADLGPRLIYNTKERITALGIRSSNAKPIKAGTLLMSFKLTLGRASIAGCDIFTNEAIAAFVPINGQVDDTFLYYVLPPLASNAITETAIKGKTLNKKSLSKLRICLPESITQQRRIAEILSTIDEEIEQTEALIEKLKKIKAGMMHDLFTRGVTSDGKLRPPCEEAPHLYKQSPLGWIPKEWEVAHFDELAGITSGQVDPREVPYCDWILVAPDHIESATGRLLFTRTASEQGAISGKYTFEPGYIIYSKIRPYLRKAILASFRGVCSADMYPLCPLSGVNPKYLLELLLGEHFSRFAESVSMRSGFPKLNRNELSTYSCACAPSYEQKAIAAVAVNIDQKVATVYGELTKLRQVRHGLMHDLLTGRLRVELKQSGGSTT